MGKSVDANGLDELLENVDNGGTQFVNQVGSNSFFTHIWTLSRALGNANLPFISGIVERTGFDAVVRTNLRIEDNSGGNANKVRARFRVGAGPLFDIFSLAPFAGGNVFEILELIGTSSAVRLYRQGIFQNEAVTSYTFPSGDDYRFLVSAFKNDSVTVGHYDGISSRPGFGVIPGSISDAAADALALEHLNDGNPIDNASILNLKHGYDIEGSTAPTIDDDVADPGAADLTMINMDQTNIVDDFPSGDPVPTVDFCDITVRMEPAVSGILVIATTSTRGYFLADDPVDAGSSKVHNPSRTIRAVTDSSGIAHLVLPTVNNRRTGQEADSWTINIDKAKYSRRISVPDAATAELADITID